MPSDGENSGSCSCSTSMKEPCCCEGKSRRRLRCADSRVAAREKSNCLDGSASYRPTLVLMQRSFRTTTTVLLLLLLLSETNRSSRAHPTTISDVPCPYQGAVSSNVIPHSSIAQRIVSIHSLALGWSFVSVSAFIPAVAFSVRSAESSSLVKKKSEKLEQPKPTTRRSAAISCHCIRQTCCVVLCCVVQHHRDTRRKQRERDRERGRGRDTNTNTNDFSVCD
mmetsp:Transcript_10262/g.21553  ORF Transcript_10262/g.21553 Transcript_10262/m.21553 type:complete len:223 (-) Transcript_10262:373-1041(-)